MTTEALPLWDWRCGRCGASRPLGRYTALGAVYLLHSLHMLREAQGGSCRLSRHILVDLAAGTIAIHCSHCHDWRGLTYGREAGTYTEAAWRGARPAGSCTAAAEPG